MSSFTPNFDLILRRYRLFALLTFAIFCAISIRDVINPVSPPIVQLTRYGVDLVLLGMAFAFKPSPFMARHLSKVVFLTFLAIQIHLINITWHRSLHVELVILDLVAMMLVTGVVHNLKLCLAVLISWSVSFAVVSYLIPNPHFSPIYFVALMTLGGVVSYSLLSVILNAQDRLEAKEKILLKTQAVARMAGWEFNADKGQVIWSNSAYKLLEITDEDSPFDAAVFFKKPEEFIAFERQLRSCIKHCEELNTTVSICKTNGQNMWLQCRGDVVLQYGKPVGMIGVILDVTETVIRERELVKAKELAETAAEARTRFLANMSHEIRTPMNGVIGMTSILLNGDLPEKEHAYVEIIRRSGEALLVIINEILDFSKYDSGSVVLDERKFSMAELVSDALDAISTQAEQKGLDIYLDMPLLPHLDYIGDSSRLRQVLVNLLGNAVKFTEEGHIALTIKTRAHSDNASYFEIEVSDTGIGIAQHNIAHLFDPFTQEDASTTRRFGGTGLGLAISNEIISAMDGNISVFSTLRKGSKFSFSIKLKAGEKAKIITDHLGNIALISQDKTLTEILSKNVDALGGSLSSYQSANQLLENGATIKSLSAILIDTDMDKHDTITEMIEQLESHNGAQLILVGSTALKFQTLKHPWLRKPVRVQELLKTLQRNDKHDDNESQTQEPISKHAKLSVLLAEDNIVNQKVAQYILEKLGCIPDLAENGKEAVHLLTEKKYDIILMDIQMPEIDGLEATQLIRSDPEMQQPYIIAMTANAMEDDRQQCLAAGMDDFISKPVRIDDVSKAMERAHIQISQKLAKDKTIKH